MSLADLVVDCRVCGGESFISEGRSAACTDCGAEYRYDPDTDALTWTGGLVGNSGGAPGGVPEARVSARFAFEEIPVRYHDGLLGFIEQRGPHTPGTLRLHPDRVEFVEDRGPTHTWDLLDVRAVQTASSSVQISPLEGGVVTFALAGPSPRRWEGLLREAVTAAWKAAGRGTVVEFQPRIRAE